MNAISTAFAASATPSTPTLHGIGARLAEIHLRIGSLQGEDEPRSRRSYCEETQLQAEYGALHEVILSAQPQTLADALVVVMVLSYEVSIVADPGPNRSWKCSPVDRADALTDAFLRAALRICEHVNISPESVGGKFYASHLLEDNGATT